MKQKIIITALPNGNGMSIRGRGTILKASAAISLQVEAVDKADTRLSDVADMLKWADLIKNAKFLVQVNGNTVEAKVTSAAVDTALWKNLFAPTVKVAAFVPEPLHNIPIVSYPVKHVLDFIKGVVEQTGKSFANDLPDSNFYTENPIFNAIADYSVPNEIPRKGREQFTMDTIVSKKETFRRMSPMLRENKFIPFNNNPSPAADFAQLKNFHGLYNAKTLQTAPIIDKPDFEFHDILSIISNYPQLQRKLGLVIDFEFVAPEDKIVLASNVHLRIIPHGINFSAATTIVCPATQYIRTDNGFYAKPESNSVMDKGHLKINTDAFTVFQLDTDGAALKLCQQVDALLLKKAKHIFYAAENNMPNAAAIPIFNNEMPRKEGLPANRTAGIGIARNGMAEKLHIKFNRMKELIPKLMTGNPAPAGITGTNANWILSADTLTADDITLGFRMDIQPEDKPGQWFSLHKRMNTYTFINSSGTNIDIPGMDADEGFIQTSATEEKTDAGTQLKVGEAIARWEGWSLSIPRPGSALNEPLTEDKEVYSEKDGTKNKEADKYKTPGTADFKLNVLPAIVKGSLPMLRFGKKYSIKIRMVDLAGNSTAVTALPENSSECIKPSIKYMRYEPVDAPFLKLGNEIKDGESGEIMVIRSNEGIPAANYESDNLKKGQTKAYAGEAVRHVMPPRTTVEMATTHGMLDLGIGAANNATAINYYKFITGKKDPAFANTDKMYEMKVENADANTLNVEYLTDPMALGVSFFLSSNDPNPKITSPEIFDRFVSFYFDTPATLTKLSFDTWMKPNTFRIKLQEGSPNIEWIAGERTLKVTLQKGAIVKMNYACFWNPADLEKISGVLDMMNPPTLTDAIKQRIAKGQHWMFSPWREITFVHAVQQPLSTVAGKQYPAIEKIEPDRNYGDNFALLNSQFSVHGPSTGQLDIEASWKEPDDDITKDAMVMIDNRSKVFHYTTLYPVFDYVFGNPAPVKNNPFPALRHSFNDTKHRIVNYKTIATTRYKENFFNLIKDKGDAAFPITREGNTITKIIPSSARPASPDMAYVIPTFEWERGTKGSVIVTGRVSGLRVYLKRPWYSSGEGEQLAVVLAIPTVNFGASSISSAGVPVTTWGTDPSKMSSPLPGGILPTQDSFINIKAENKDTMLSSVENSTAKVCIVAVDVKYDTQRHLYYVDIMLNGGLAYYPFVRLAVARYQKNSLRKDNTDCCLSPIVQTDYIQVPPPRASSLETKGRKNDIVVAISGTTPAVSNAGSMFRTRVEFIIEPLDIPSSESAHITVNPRPIDSYSYIINEGDVKNFAFYHSHAFNLPSEYASKPYRVKVLEYEMIEYDRLKPNPNPGGVNFGSMPTKDRLVFADVYEVK